jgi:hypothetical protein
MNTDVFDELLAFSHLPLARLPRAPLTAWFAFLRGNQSMDGVPIPAHELSVGPLLRPALERLEPGRLQMAVNHVLAWLWPADAADRSDALTQPHLEAVSVLLDASPELSALFLVRERACRVPDGDSRHHPY